MLKLSREGNINQLKCKHKKPCRLISQKPIDRDIYNIPVVSLSSNELDVSGLNYGLHQSFRNKNKHIKRNIAVELEALSSNSDPFINDDSKENFHEYLRPVPNDVK